MIASLLTLTTVLLQQLSLASADSPSANTNISTQEEDLWVYEYFHRGSANVQWCEDVVASHAHDEWIAEYYNTWSNLVFCLAAAIGLWRCHTQKLSGAFYAAEWIMMVGVGLGSFLFHAHQSRWAQCSDELPMSLLLLAQTHCLENLHPWTTLKEGQRFRPFYVLNHSFVFLFWMAYFYSENYEIFVNGFGIQILIQLSLAYDIDRRMKRSHQKWFCSVGFLTIGKLCWEVERSLYRSNSCSATGTLWLHPIWHVAAAISNAFAMSGYCDQIQEARLNKNNISKAVVDNCNGSSKYDKTD